MKDIIYQLGVYQVRRGKPVQVWNAALDRCITMLKTQKDAREFVDKLATDRALVAAVGAENAMVILQDFENGSTGASLHGNTTRDAVNVKEPVNRECLGRIHRVSDLQPSIEQKICDRLKEKIGQGPEIG